MDTEENRKTSLYVELDHKLVPRKIENINDQDNLPGREKPDKQGKFHSKDQFQVNKYNIDKKGIHEVIEEFRKLKTQTTVDYIEVEKRDLEARKRYADDDTDEMQTIAKEEKKLNDTINKEAENNKIQYEAVLGSKEEVYYDLDWGFFSAVLAAYNNHWVLRTSPDDWWSVIVRTVAQAVDDNGDKANVRSFFVDHEGQKEIEIILGDTLFGINYSWLFDQFSEGVKKNIRTPGYVDLMQADFSSSGTSQIVASQIMMMASVQKYFSFSMRTTRCGIPGVEMVGAEEDWEKLVEKVDKLETLLGPIMEEIGLGSWFGKTRSIVMNLLDTYNGNPDKEWWGHILNWNVTHGSGARQWWEGWMPEFLIAKGSKPTDFPSGLVSVPLKIIDKVNPPPVEDTGLLVAGTVGFTVEEVDRCPVVEAKQGWSLLMPKESKVTERLLKHYSPQ